MLIDASSVWRAESARSFARAIRGQPTIVCFESDTMFSYEASDALYLALATLPALESITLSNRRLYERPEDESALTHPESLMELSRVPSLRSVYCSFVAGECAGIVAKGLARNTSVLSILLDEPL
jgi:hypothetical protein